MAEEKKVMNEQTLYWLSVIWQSRRIAERPLIR